MSSWLRALLLGAACMLAPGLQAAEEGLSSLPTGSGLPVQVQVGVAFNEIDSFDDNLGEFQATTDLRLVWKDLRLRYPAAEGLHGYKELRFSAADAELQKIWSPQIEISNRIEKPKHQDRRLRLFPDGRVELILRTTARYRTPVDVRRFPFDRQRLELVVKVRENITAEVELVSSAADVAYTRAGSAVLINGWDHGLGSLQRNDVHGWNGDRYARITAALEVQRQPGATLSTIFIPLFASLLLPFLVTWVTELKDGEFTVGAGELSHYVIGGLFAIIAFALTLPTQYPVLSASDNTATRLIALNYVALAVGLLISIILCRYRLVRRWFGPWVEAEVFRVLGWAFPLTTLAIGSAVVVEAAL